MAPRHAPTEPPTVTVMCVQHGRLGDSDVLL